MNTTFRVIINRVTLVTGILFILAGCATPHHSIHSDGIDPHIRNCDTNSVRVCKVHNSSRVRTARQSYACNCEVKE